MTYRDTSLPVTNDNSSPIAYAVGLSPVMMSVFLLGSVQRHSRISNFFQIDACTLCVRYYYYRTDRQTDDGVYKYANIQKSDVHVSTDNIVY